MAGKGTKLIRLGRVQRFVELERGRIKDLDGVQREMSDYGRAVLEGRKEALQRLEEWLGIEEGGRLERAK